jgi:hypothetical protein
VFSADAGCVVVASAIADIRIEEQWIPATLPAFASGYGLVPEGDDRRETFVNVRAWELGERYPSLRPTAELF